MDELKKTKVRIVLTLFILLLNKINHMSKMSLVPHEEVQKHLANNSPSKVSFRFSKTKRFKANNPECPIAFYSYGSQLSNRKAAIGYGKKSDFTLDLPKAPAGSDYDPNNYHEFIKSRGLSFGLSREQSPDQSYLIPQIHKHPGVGNYEYQKASKNNSSYSIRPKTIDMIERNLTYKKDPGPGAYEAVELDPKLKTKVSKFKGAQLGIIPHSQRFMTIKDGPGPHNYNDLDPMSATARYVVSSHKGRGTRPFTRERRFTHQHWRPSRNPGPSDYQKPSDFGLYGDSKYYKGLSTID